VLVYVWAAYRGSSQSIALLDTKNSRYYVGNWLSPPLDGQRVGIEDASVSSR
jgi:hypothetical protein